MQNLMIIDSNAIGYAGHNTTPLYSGTQQTQSVFHFLKSARKMMMLHPDYQPICLWDNVAKWRYDLNPHYKSDRSNDPEKVKRREDYKTQRPFIQRSLVHLGINQMSAVNREADDLAGYLSRVALEKGAKVMLVTGDEDWIQLIGENCDWLDPIHDKFRSMSNLLETTGYVNTQQFLEGKALVGDTSDNIPGIGGIGDKGAPEFIAQYGSVTNFLKMADEGKLPAKMPVAHKRLAENIAPPPSKKYGALAPARDAWERNMKLMDLRSVARPSKEDFRSVKGRFNVDKFEEVCAELAFHSILRTMDSWIKPFEKARGV